ncbi:MAG: SPOR domain-containing protein [Bacteroidaceae bacterium]|nr:SPOR domain-containing protein [Bacteroidaceae bacterium]
MKDLSFYIEHLLLEHDCVVLPQFGAFITLSNPAQRVEDEALFLPPKRMVRFTTDVVEDDGLLVGALQEEMNLSTTDAKKHLQRLILSLRQQLLTEGQMDFGSLGVLSQDEDGHLMFSPCLAGVMTPHLFGLDGFTFPLLASKQDRSAKRMRRAVGEDDNNQSITIRINRRFLHYAAAIAAVIVLAVVLLQPHRFNGNSSTQQASILPQEPAQTSVQSSTVSMKAEGVVASPALEAAEQTSTTQTESQQTAATESEETAQEQTSSSYVIVIACAISRNNADILVERLHEKGLPNAEVMETGNMRRVVLGGYDSESEAYTQAAALRKLQGDFAYAWVMELK